MINYPFYIFKICGGKEQKKTKKLSSVNNRTRLKRFSAMSFTYTKNRSGPNTERWATPAFTDRREEVAEFILTLCFLEDR